MSFNSFSFLTSVPFPLFSAHLLIILSVNDLSTLDTQLHLSYSDFLFLLRQFAVIIALSLFLSDRALLWVTPCYHDDSRDPGGCPVQCGPAGGAAPPRPAAMHRAPSLLHHVPGTRSVTTAQHRPRLFTHFPCTPFTPSSRSFRRLILTPTLKTGMPLWPASPAI